jgi:peptidyl-prolyl cis-trans isomerase SurA
MSQRIAATRALLLAAIALLGVASVAPIALAQPIGDVAADEQLTERDIEQRGKLERLLHNDPSRQGIIDELRDDRRKIRDAKKAGIDVSDAEVDVHYAEIARRMHSSAEQLTAQLAKAGVDADTLKQRIRADLTTRRALGVRPPQPAR